MDDLGAVGGPKGPLLCASKAPGWPCAPDVDFSLFYKHVLKRQMLVHSAAMS